MTPQLIMTIIAFSFTTLVQIGIFVWRLSQLSAKVDHLADCQKTETTNFEAFRREIYKENEQLREKFEKRLGDTIEKMDKKMEELSAQLNQVCLTLARMEEKLLNN